jgi:hypothetical protein
LLLEVASPFCRHQHTFPEGRQYLDSHSLLMRDLGRHRGKHHRSLLSLAPITFDANTFSCYGGSYFATIAVLFVICRRPLNLVGPSMPTSSSLLITVIIAYYSEYVPLQNCLLPLSFTAPEGAAVVYTNTSVIFFQSYITRAWGMPASFVHSCIFFHACLSEGRDTGSFFLQRIVPNGPTIAFPYNNSLSRRNIDGFRLYVCS